MNKVFFESILGSIDYKPSKEPEASEVRKMIANFYFLTSYLSDYSGEDSWNVQYTVKTAIDSLISILSPAGLYSLSAEFRHAYKRAYPYKENLDQRSVSFIEEFEKQRRKNRNDSEIQKVLNDNGIYSETDLSSFESMLSNGNRYSEYAPAFVAVKMAQKKLSISNSDFASIFSDCVSIPSWYKYNGKFWNMIATTWNKMSTAVTQDDKIVYLDTFINLEHKTGSVFNKLRLFYDESSGGYDWIKKLLNWKRDVKDVREYMDKVSFSIKKAVQFVIGQTNKSSNQLMVPDDEPEQKEIDPNDKTLFDF